MLIHIIDIAKQEKQKLGLPSFLVEEWIDMSCNAQGILSWTSSLDTIG